MSGQKGFPKARSNAHKQKAFQGKAKPKRKSKKHKHHSQPVPYVSSGNANLTQPSLGDGFGATTKPDASANHSSAATVPKTSPRIVTTIDVTEDMLKCAKPIPRGKLRCGMLVARSFGTPATGKIKLSRKGATPGPHRMNFIKMRISVIMKKGALNATGLGVYTHEGKGTDGMEDLERDEHMDLLNPDQTAYQPQTDYDPIRLRHVVDPMDPKTVIHLGSADSVFYNTSLLYVGMLHDESFKRLYVAWNDYLCGERDEEDRDTSEFVSDLPHAKKGQILEALAKADREWADPDQESEAAGAVEVSGKSDFKPVTSESDAATDNNPAISAESDGFDHLSGSVKAEAVDSTKAADGNLGMSNTATKRKFNGPISPAEQPPAKTAKLDSGYRTGTQS